MLNILWLGLAVLLGMLAGNGAVYVFNRLPAKWLCDYGEVPAEDKLGRQRIPSTPWKVFFSCLMMCSGAYLSFKDPLYTLAVMAVMWFLILISISDRKYMIIPDELSLMVFACSIGFYHYHENVLDMVLGAVIGGGVMLLIALLGKLISKREALGMGDVKLMACLGPVLGIHGTIFTLCAMGILSGFSFMVMLMLRWIKKDDYQPLAMYISMAAIIYFLVIWPLEW